MLLVLLRGLQVQKFSESLAVPKTKNNRQKKGKFKYHDEREEKGRRTKGSDNVTERPRKEREGDRPIET